MMKGKHRLIRILDTLRSMTQENPCGWSDGTLGIIADGISVLVSERTKAGITLMQMSDYFGVTLRTLERWRKRFDDFPHPIDPYAKTLTFPIDAIMEWKMKHASCGDID